ncbi:MAG: hypothetical protein IJ105_04030 [Bacilli bacterium]|nr:hypothetical protein [Bacilli bacterium]
MPDNKYNYTRRDSNVKLKECYKKIINSNDPVEIENIIKESNYPYGQIKSNFYFYSKYFSKEEQDIFNNKFQKYLEYHKIITKKNSKERIEKIKQERLQNAINVLELYFNNIDNDLNKFLTENNLTKTSFDSYLKVVKNNNTELYEKYINHINRIDEYNDIELIIKQFADKLENGYVLNDKKRDFDVLDYFSLLNIPIKNIYKISSPYLNQKQLLLVKKFMINNQNSDVENESDIKVIREEKRIFGLEYDKFGKIIEGSGREITKEETEKIINYLTDNEIPLNRKTYNAALKRYLNNYISFEETKKLKLN